MASQSAKHSGLGSDYEGLSGQELLGKLAEEGEVATLEALQLTAVIINATAHAAILTDSEARRAVGLKQVGDPIPGVSYIPCGPSFSRPTLSTTW